MPDVCRPRKRHARVFEIVNVVARELKAGQLKESRPANAIDPLANAFVFARVPLYTSTIFFTASTTSGQRGGLLGKYGIASRENRGALRALLTLPPTQIDSPSFSASAIGIAGQTLKQLPQYMQCSSITSTDCLPTIRQARAGSRRWGRTRSVSALRKLSYSNSLIHLGRPAMHAENGDIRAMHRAAHVQAACHRDAQLGRQILVREVIDTARPSRS